MAAKGVYLKLREGVARATLPDNRTMVEGKKYLVSVDDFQKLSRSVRETVVSVEGIETKASVVHRAFGDTDTMTVDDQFMDLEGECGGDDEEIADAGYKAGMVLQGLNGEAFKLCKVSGGADENDVLVWEDKATSTVTKGEGEFAGVLVGDTATGTWGWIQTEGVVSVANAETGVGAGDSLKVTTDGTFDTAAEDGDTVATALSGESGGEIEVALRSTRVRNRYVKRPNIFYPGQ